MLNLVIRDLSVWRPLPVVHFMQIERKKEKKNPIIEFSEKFRLRILRHSYFLLKNVRDSKKSIYSNFIILTTSSLSFLLSLVHQYRISIFLENRKFVARIRNKKKT